ncbi:MAG: menaquinone biosynthesis protein [SAR202 cluster bacterium]|nr:menaquinone biosynthesis protein [SAR202 cluster bacterium]|tara:strand:- start:6030 stop:6827 length:798 start_codon:yes stop_codon:yes gene_type:complete
MNNNRQLLSIGHMTYLNSEVFYWRLSKTLFNLVPMHPRAMAAALERGDLAAGPLPIAEIMRMNGQVRSLGDLGVSSHGAAKSVFLFSRVPVGKLSGTSIAVTSHTATSIQLLRVLFNDFWKVHDHKFVGVECSHEAALWIGDPALELRYSSEYDFIYDLGTAWTTLTGKPFVFAEWVVRTDIPIEQASELERQLLKATQEGVRNIDEISRFRANQFLTESDVSDYVRNFSYFLGDKERLGQMEFQRRLDQLPTWRPDLKAVESLR